jgi:hypothetical protein
MSASPNQGTRNKLQGRLETVPRGNLCVVAIAGEFECGEEVFDVGGVDESQAAVLLMPPRL